MIIFESWGQQWPYFSVREKYYFYYGTVNLYPKRRFEMELTLITVGKIAFALLAGIGNVGSIILMQKGAEKKLEETIEKKGEDTEPKK